MVQEEKMESKLGPLDVIMYAAILCVHYPLRIVLASYRLVKATIVKAASTPRQILGYTTVSLIAIFESSEKKIVEVLHVLASLPSRLLGKLKNFSAEDSKTKPKKEKDLTNYTEIALSFVKKTSDAVYGFFVVYANLWRHILLLPLKLILLSLKVGKNLLATLLNSVESGQKTEMDRTDQKSITSHVIDYFIIVMANLQYYLVYAIAIVEKLMSQVSSLIISTPRHLFSLVKTIYLKSVQLVALTIIFIYNVGRYSFFYVFMLVGKALRRPVEKRSDQEALAQKNLSLKEELARVQAQNDHHKCMQQVKNLESEMNGLQVAFDDERQEYIREIENLKLLKQEKIDYFNSERTKLQAEVRKLQAFIAQVQKENDEEGRNKKQEAINLDNEKNQLQERIQMLQSQVVTLKKQNEAMASSYSESAQDMAVSFGKEREGLLVEVEQLQKQIKQMELMQDEAKRRYFQLLGQNQSIQENMHKLEESLDILKRSNATHRLKRHKPSCSRNGENGKTNLTIINKTLTDFHYETAPAHENGGAPFQNTVDEVIKHLDQLYHFNQERFLLHGELEKLQTLVEDMQKKNEERLKLDREDKNVQKLQEQVADLQNQNIVMALSYSEANRITAEKFAAERENLLHQVERLLNKAEEKDKDINEDNQFQLLGKNGMTAIKHGILHKQEGGNLLEDLCNVCKRIEKELVNFTEACQNLSNLHHPQNTIDEMKKVLVELADGVVPQIEVQPMSGEEESTEEEFRDQIQAQLNEIVQKGLENYETLDARSKAIDINMIVVKNQIEKIQETLHGMKAHLDVRDDKLDRLRNCHTRAVKILREEKSKISILRDQIEGMEKALKEAENEKLTLQTTSTEKDLKIDSLERENAELSKNLHDLQIHLEAQERERAHEEKLHKAVVVELQRELENLQVENDERTKNLHDLQIQLEAQKRERAHEEKLHKAVVVELQRELENLQVENDERTRDFDQKLKEIQSEKLHERDEMVNRLRLHHERAMKEFKDEKIQLSNLRIQVDSMEKTMREDQEQKMNYQTALSQSDLKISFLSRENSELKQKVNDLQDELEQKENAYQATHDNNEKLHRAVVVEMQREMDDMENEHEQNVTKLSEKIQNLQSERIILLDQNMELQNVVEFLNKEVEKWKKAKKPFFSTK